MTITISTTGTQVDSTPLVFPNAGVVALPYTKMPIHDWASRLGLNPVHFSGGVMSGRFMQSLTCSGAWSRHTWQAGYNLSHMDVAIAISTAESLIEEYLGYHVAPDWRIEDHPYPRYKRIYRTAGRDLTGRRPAIQMERSKIISVSVEKRDYIGTYAVTYQDLDGDGYSEIAYVSVPNSTSFPANEVHLFPAGLADNPAWQIRYPKRWGIVGTDRYFLIDFWMMIDPEIMARLPGETYNPPNLDNPASLITHVDAYHVYQATDPYPVQLEWENGSWCLQEDITTRNATGIVRDPESALIAPNWTDVAIGGTPDRARISYYSGLMTREFLSGYTLNPLGGHLADAVFYLATARLTRDICACAEARALAVELRQDMALVSPQGNFLAVADVIQESPFGTRRGEWLAYQALKLVDRHIEVAVF